MHKGSVRWLALGFAFVTFLGACASTTSSSDGDESSTAQCQQGSNWPSTAPELVASTSGNVDFDGEPDEVSLFAQSVDDGEQAWLRVDFSNGGTVTGSWDGEPFEAVADTSVQVADLTSEDDASNINEIILQVGERTAVGGRSVVALEECSIVTTTLDGEAFVFGSGWTDGVSTIAGCSSIGSDDVVQLIVNARSFGEGEWLRETFVLDGREWALTESRVFSDFPEGDGSILFPVGPTLDTCLPAAPS